jgi:hypothetical protein
MIANIFCSGFPKEMFHSHTHSILLGNGLLDHATGAYRALTEGVRKGATKRFNDFLLDPVGGQQAIVHLAVVRKPVLRGVQWALNLLSLGGFERVKRYLKYDDVYHNLLIVTLGNGRQVLLEKNHVVEFRTPTPADLQQRQGNIPIPPGITIASLVAKASAADPRAFWQYDARDNNCQRFTIQMAAATGLGVSDPYAISLLQQQDAEALVASLGALQHIPKRVTDLAGTLDRVRYGDGAFIAINRRLKF